MAKKHNEAQSDRPVCLPGRTYKIKAPNPKGEQINIYITLNDDSDGNLFEAFFNCSDATLYEWLSITMVLVSRQLRHGVSAIEIAHDMEQVHSSTTSHFIPGGGGFCSSLVARIGRVLREHVERMQDEAAGSEAPAGQPTPS